MNKKYNIYYCSDNNGIQLMKQSIRSIGKNCTSKYVIHCLTTNLSNEEINELKKYFLPFDNINVIIYDCTNILSNKFNDYDKIAYLKHISKATMMRLYVNRVINLNDIDRILYLDNDTYINKDLKELFEIDLDDYYIAAVRDTFINWTKHFPHRMDRFYIEMKDDANYFNGGVELLNVKNIIRKNIFSELQNFKLKPYMKLTDQDIYNIVFKGKVKYLDLRYNCKWWMNFNKNDMYIIHAAGHENQLKYIKMLDIGIYPKNNIYKDFSYYDTLNKNADINKLKKPNTDNKLFNIYYCTDINNFDLMKMSIQSLINNSNKNCNYIVHCLTYGLNDDLLSKINSLNIYNIKIKTYDCTKILDELGNYNDYKNSNSSISKVTMLKMYVDKIIDLKNIDKLLYLDNDVYINQDLEHLFKTDLTGKYIGAVRDIIILWSGAWDSHSYYDKYRKTLNYFNGGVELLNVKEMLNDNKFYELQMASFKNNAYELADQDIYNDVLGDKVEYLSLYYNYKWWLSDWDFDKIYIMHFSGCKKKQLIYMNFLLNGYKNIPHKCNWDLCTTDFRYYYNKNFEFED